jgi:hypothetical protein
MWNFGTMHHQGPKDSRSQSKPGAPFLASLARSGAFSPTAEDTPSAPDTPWIPNAALPPVHPDSINSIVRKTLLATPEFPRLYADLVLSTRPNSAEAKILRPKYQKILHRINLMQNRNSCTHIKISGVRCGSPSLRGQQFCYYHQRMHRGVRTPPQSRLHPLACIEDKESIQAALAEVINALLRNTIDMKRATLILRALHIAVKNDARASVKAQASNIVKEVPEYDEIAPTRMGDGLIDLEVPFEASFGQDPRASKPQLSYQTPEEFEKQRNEMIANYYGFPTVEAHAAAKKNGWTPYTQAQENAKKAEPTTAHDEESPRRDSLSGCPGGPAVSVRSAVAPSAVTPHNVTKLAAKSAPSSPASNPANSGALSPQRKPPVPVKEVPASLKQVKAANAAPHNRTSSDGEL